MSRDKGKRGEREVVAMLQEHVVDEVCAELGVEPPLVERNLNQAFQGGCDIVGVPGVAVEVKFREQLSPDVWWEQTLQQASTVPGALPVMFYRKSRVRWRARTHMFTGGRVYTVELVSSTEYLPYLRHVAYNALSKK